MGMVRILNTAISLPAKEAYIIFLFIRNDIWDTVIPTFLTFIAAFFYNRESWRQFPTMLLYASIYNLLYILTFCIANQVNGVEEDRLNKPYRPLVRGVLTVREAEKRSYIYNALFLFTAYLLDVFWYALSWQLVTLMMCNWGFSNHWFLKNVFCISIGTILLLGAQWRIVGDEIQLQIWNFIFFLSFWAGAGLPLQDFRDQDGDRYMRRKTLPLVLGDLPARRYMIAHMMLLSPLLYFFTIATQIDDASEISSPKMILVTTAQVLWHWIIALRIWLYRNPAADDTSYHYFVCLFCVTIPMICFL
ncbi:UbiA family prenyltransferase [Chitinophaga oryzae]|uniref:UbiA family prenyltransferase n=1 Tax=Chitinophaga oryzae TaxID=2725414 RepID=A0AAE6ZLH0_9BACT|nr:UbiA family prenyltransferase [Chitinophaga oryzae]QJB34889.1 UbiA family prenyltransferase [Chitinophaga oryzae]QJB41400.1 UbiA family prenyltransferase [Chitinophaga oryzae]